MKTQHKRQTYAVGDKVQKYEIAEIIHSAGMSTVYRVLDPSLNKSWCLKEVRIGQSEREKREQRALEREILLLKDLSSHGIPRIIETLEVDNSRFFVMDFIEGESLQQIINRGGALPVKTAIPLLTQTAFLLKELHENNIVYRDMKPDNLMLQKGQRIVLLDFGISQKVDEVLDDIEDVKELRLGTKFYAPPEQSKGGKPDKRNDIYSFGVTMFALLTGVAPAIYRKNDKNKRFSLREIDLKFPLGLEEIVRKCTEEKLEARYQNCDELINALNNYETLDENYRKKAKRKLRTINALIGAGALSMISAGALWLAGQQQIETRYSALVAVAEQSGRIEDFDKAIRLKPTNLNPYQGLIGAIKQDGVFDKQEEQILLNLVNPVLSEMKKQDAYPALAEQIGRLYWFFYQTGDGQTLANQWLNDALGGDLKDSEQTKVLYALSTFKKEIPSAIQESLDAGLYRSFWDSLTALDAGGSGEVVGLQVQKEIVSAVVSYGPRLKSDGVKKEEITQQLQQIKNSLASFSPSPGRPQELSAEITQMLDLAEQAVNATFIDLEVGA